MKTKIAFYLKNKNTIDCSNIIDGNPGLGGSEYLIILIPTLLSQRYNDINITLYTDYQGVLPHDLHVIKCSSFTEFADKCQKNKEDYCVVNYTAAENDVISDNTNVKFIIWCHNFVSWKNLNFYARQKNVVRIIAVGREQLDLYRDHPAYSKSDYIYNAIPTHSLKEYTKKIVPFSKREQNVVYIGSLIECKGFLYLAKAWKKVLRSIPKAKLYVIGKGNLYDENAKLGPYNLADNDFEEKFIPYLSDKKGILPSVKFLGVLGNNKFEIINQCKVGVPNPGGLTETFGLTAIEMQAMGCVVTTIKCPGYLDTVHNKDFLYKKTSQLADYIIKALKTENAPKLNDLIDFIEENFSYDIVLPQWHRLFIDCIPNDVFLHSDENGSLTNGDYHYKWLKEFLRKNKNRFLVHIIPPIEQLLYKQH